MPSRLPCDEPPVAVVGQRLANHGVRVQLDTSVCGVLVVSNPLYVVKYARSGLCVRTRAEY